MKTQKLTILLLVGLFSVVSLSMNAQEEQNTNRGRHRQSPGEGENGHFHRSPGFKGGWLERLKTENPEEFERLQKLRDEDPEKFREEIRRMSKERFGGMIRQKGRQLEAKCRELSQKYRDAEGEADKAAAKEQLQVAVKEAFDARVAAQKEMVKNLEEQLAKLKKQIAEREENREKICEERVESLIKGPTQRW